MACFSRCLEEDRSHQTTLTSTPHCTASAPRAAPCYDSGTPGRKPPSRSKSSSKTPSERVRWVHGLVKCQCQIAHRLHL